MQSLCSDIVFFFFILHQALICSSVQPLGHFFSSTADRNISTLDGKLPDELKWLSLNNVSHFRLIPGTFPEKMKYHFDGFASVMKFSFHDDGSITYIVKSYKSDAHDHYDTCDFYGSGTGPTHPAGQPCLINPVVNLLPIAGELWLTIDTRFWGSIDPDTLETIKPIMLTDTITLNAHPACEPFSSVCYVEHPCVSNPITDQVCISLLIPGEDGKQRIMKPLLISQTTLPDKVMIQHSHSPSLTETLIISKIDSFELRKKPDENTAGILKLMHQKENNLFMITNKVDNVSYIAKSNLSFVNNHFWNSFDVIDEATNKKVSIVSTIPATSTYLNQYFHTKLSEPSVDWESILSSPKKCVVPNPTLTDIGTVDYEDIAKEEILCSELLEEPRIMDYPTYNPLVKTKHYKYFYAISLQNTTTSRWFDTIVKFDVDTGKLLSSWHRQGVYLTEVDFIPKDNVNNAEEDDGVLISVLYDSAQKKSALALFNAKDLSLIASFYLKGDRIGFHAHGIVCTAKQCYSNP